MREVRYLYIRRPARKAEPAPAAVPRETVRDIDFAVDFPQVLNGDDSGNFTLYPAQRRVPIPAPVSRKPANGRPAFSFSVMDYILLSFCGGGIFFACLSALGGGMA